MILNIVNERPRDKVFVRCLECGKTHKIEGIKIENDSWVDDHGWCGFCVVGDDNILGFTIPYSFCIDHAYSLPFRKGQMRMIIDDMYNSIC